MLRSWSFTDLEFLALWQERGAEFLPEPLMFSSRTQWWSEHLDAMARTRDSLPHERDPEWQDIFDTLSLPDVRIEVRGRDGRDASDPKGSIRLLGARRGDFGYLVVQQPGETVSHSAGFDVTACDAGQLAAELIAALPDVAAGRGPELVLAESADIEDHDYAFGLSPAHETMEGTVIDRAAEFLAAPAVTRGVIEIVQGYSRFGPRGITRHRVDWRDLVDDGRYVVTGDYPRVAAPADPRRMVATVQTRIDEVLVALGDE
ncbi:ESX secretion-associated protein EspG [Nocardia sp. NBC_01503]|uniref:ESX secretion-associated protein EspG n=1 Tax=Nocardia sp. NBC_01503 TaxID=2975997 RepID=UPI002E7C44A7|nr:ESX secretion-associated protein EspG [Nocardia sp. NBC_01503]WTL33951.1 ESX secretion-associated protein EspG [Nocardia sp. NBC_01503]